MTLYRKFLSNLDPTHVVHYSLFNNNDIKNFLKSCAQNQFLVTSSNTYTIMYDYRHVAS